jgi:hypothetical protein
MNYFIKITEHIRKANKQKTHQLEFAALDDNLNYVRMSSDMPEKHKSAPTAAGSRDNVIRKSSMDAQSQCL